MLLSVFIFLFFSFEEDFKKGTALYENGKYKEALSLFESLLKTRMDDKQRVAVLSNAAAAAYALGLYSRAVSHLKVALKIEPDNTTLRLSLVRALALCGRRKEALRELRGLKEVKEIKEILKSAVVAIMPETPSEVLLLRLLVAIGAGDGRVRERLVGLLISQRRYYDARAEAEAWVKAEPLNGRAWFYLAVAAEKVGDVEGSEDASQIALALGEKKARLLLVSVLENRGMFFSSALLLSASDRRDERLRAARVAIQARSPYLALQILQKEKGGESDGLRALALLCIGKREEARELAEEVLKSNPANADAKAVLKALETQE